MANRKRKHGIFVVNGDVVGLSNSKEERSDCTHINIALNMVFNQMRIAGNLKGNIRHGVGVIKYFLLPFVPLKSCVKLCYISKKEHL